MTSRIRRKLLYKFFRQSWNVGITRHPAPTVAGLGGLKKQRQALNEMLWMAERRDAFAADPFIIQRQNGTDDYLIYYEFFPWKEGRGRIDCVDFVDGKFGAQRTSLYSPNHLSYPNTFFHDGAWVMMPEHAGSRDLSLYWLGDDGSCQSKKTIGNHMDVIDSTLLLFNNKFWLFATRKGAYENEDLYVYYSANVEGPWRMHAQNPVKRDKANARPAGPFIHHAGSLFRPAQDCSSHYGSGIVINKLTKLTEDTFEEEPVSEIRPLSGARYDFGLHTISSAGDYTAVDGARLESSIHPALNRFATYFK